MYTHDDDMATPEEQAALLDEIRTRLCNRANRAVIVYSIPSTPEERRSGKGFSCWQANAVDASFCDYQAQHAGGWWGVAISYRAKGGSYELAPQVIYEMLAQHIPKDIDRIAVIQAGSARVPDAELANRFGSKMIACIYDGKGITAHPTEQPHLIGTNWIFDLFPTKFCLEPNTFPEYEERFSQVDANRFALRHAVFLASELQRHHFDVIDALPAADFKTLLWETITEAKRRSFGVMKDPIIPEESYGEVDEMFFMLPPKIEPSPDILSLSNTIKRIYDQWTKFMIGAGFATPFSKTDECAVKVLPDDMLELGRSMPSFSTALIQSVVSGRSPQKEERSPVPSRSKAEADHIHITQAAEKLPALYSLQSLPKVSSTALISVRSVYDAACCVSGWFFLTEAFEALKEGEGVYTLVAEGPAPDREAIAFAALMCGLFPKDAKAILVVTAPVTSMRISERQELLKVLEELQAPIAFDESGILGPASGMARYCEASFRQRAYFSDDIPILPEYAASLASTWEKEVRARGEAAVFSKTTNREYSCKELGTALSEGRLVIEGTDAGFLPDRCSSSSSSPLVFMPTYHPAMPEPDCADQLAEMAVLAGIWRALLAERDGFSPSKSFPAHAQPELVEHIGHQQGIYSAVSAYYSGVPIEDIVGLDAASRIRSLIVDTMGYGAIARKAPLP